MGTAQSEPPPAGPASFGALLRRYRQEALAARAGLSVAGLSALENGRLAPYRHTVALLAGALGLSEAATAVLEAAVWRGRPSAGTASNGT